MRIINLIENTPGREGCLYEHGLSFYVETGKHNLLVDTGATDAFLKNAEHLGIDITRVDTVILSHGHYDHSGGILAFAKKNPGAKIYMQKSAGEEFFSVREGQNVYIGIDKDILELPGLHRIEGDFIIDEELFLFSGIRGRRLWPGSNLRLKKKVGEAFAQDDFMHEQCLVISAEGKRILLSGCAHNGILNILDRYVELYGAAPDAVISGFHMVQKEYSDRDVKSIQSTAEELKQYQTLFFTGHCTGKEAFELMKPIMGGQLREIHSGMEVYSGY